MNCEPRRFRRARVSDLFESLLRISSRFSGDGAMARMISTRIPRFAISRARNAESVFRVMLRSSFSTFMSLCLSVSGVVAISFFPSVRFWLMEGTDRIGVRSGSVASGGIVSLWPLERTVERVARKATGPGGARMVMASKTRRAPGSTNLSRVPRDSRAPSSVPRAGRYAAQSGAYSALGLAGEPLVPEPSSLVQRRFGLQGKPEAFSPAPRRRPFLGSWWNRAPTERFPGSGSRSPPL